MMKKKKKKKKKKSHDTQFTCDAMRCSAVLQEPVSLFRHAERTSDGLANTPGGRNGNGNGNGNHDNAKPGVGTPAVFPAPHTLSPHLRARVRSPHSLVHPV